MSRQEAKIFNDALNVPVKWQSAFKPPFFSSRWKRNVEIKLAAHIQFLEDYCDKRMDRQAGSFLCRDGIGEKFTDRSHYQLEDELGKYDAKITCSLCLKIAKKWSNKDD